MQFLDYDSKKTCRKEEKERQGIPRSPLPRKQQRQQAIEEEEYVEQQVNTGS
jgi:hypothetical protein